MSKPTPEQIAEALAHLKEIAPRIPRFSAFGDNNRERIDAQIWVLENQREYEFPNDDPDEETEDDDTNDLYYAVHEAWSWLQGTFVPEDGVDFPNLWDILIDVQVKPILPPRGLR